VHYTRIRLQRRLEKSVRILSPLEEFFPKLAGLRRLPSVRHFVSFEAPEEPLEAIREAREASSEQDGGVTLIRSSACRRRHRSA
jgi:hypothetical protein